MVDYGALQAANEMEERVVEERKHAEARLQSPPPRGAGAPTQESGRSDIAARSTLAPSRVRRVRHESAHAFASSIIVNRFESIQRPDTIRTLHPSPRLCGRAKKSGVQEGKGLAAWQQAAVAAYIEKNIGGHITARALARFVYLSSSSFRRAFKQSFGIPPHRHLAERRIERAKALLARTAWSIAEISLALGFSRTSTFSAAFRNVTGTTATEYRRTQR